MIRILIILILAFATFETLMYAVNNTVITKEGKTYTFKLADPLNLN